MHASNPTDLLSWIGGQKFLSLTHREHDWLFALEHDTQIAVECLWRLIETGHVRLTSEDHGRPFGLPAPIDAAAEVNRRIAGQLVRHAELRAGILDLELHLERGWILQVIPNSSGYEAWTVRCPIGQFIAAGGGEWAIWPNPAGP
jgi:hypothetical protein